MNQTAGLWSWIKETWQRLFDTKTPTYFKWWNKIYAFIILVPQIPVLLAEFNVVLPAGLNTWVNKAISIAGIIGIFMGKLTAANATAIAADPKDDKLPFTASKDLGLQTPPKKE